MPDEPQDAISPEIEPPQSPQEPIPDAPVGTAHPEPIDLPPVASEAPPEAVTPVPVKDHNEAKNEQKAEISEPEKEQKTPEPVTEKEIPTPVAQATVPAPNFLHNLLIRARARIQERKVKKLQKILDLLGKKNKISNDDVQKLLYVSDATATRYLSILEKQGKIRQAGKTGKAVFYTRI